MKMLLFLVPLLLSVSLYAQDKPDCEHRAIKSVEKILTDEVKGQDIVVVSDVEEGSDDILVLARYNTPDPGNLPAGFVHVGKFMCYGKFDAKTCKKKDFICLGVASELPPKK